MAKLINTDKISKIVFLTSLMMTSATFVCAGGENDGDDEKTPRAASPAPATPAVVNESPKSAAPVALSPAPADPVMSADTPAAVAVSASVMIFPGSPEAAVLTKERRMDTLLFNERTPEEEIELQALLIEIDTPVAAYSKKEKAKEEEARGAPSAPPAYDGPPPPTYVDPALEAALRRAAEFEARTVELEAQMAATQAEAATQKARADEAEAAAQKTRADKTDRVRIKQAKRLAAAPAESTITDENYFPMLYQLARAVMEEPSGSKIQPLRKNTSEEQADTTAAPEAAETAHRLEIERLARLAEEERLGRIAAENAVREERAAEAMRFVEALEENERQRQCAEAEARAAAPPPPAAVAPVAAVMAAPPPAAAAPAEDIRFSVFGGKARSLDKVEKNGDKIIPGLGKPLKELTRLFGRRKHKHKK